MTELRAGDWVVFRMQKFSNSPGPRAKNVSPSASGETYNYIVDKYWVVKSRLDDGRVLLRTRTGKERMVAADDPLLRRAKWWERWILANRFRDAEMAETKTKDQS